jgi:hypothetical protein
LSEVSNLMPGQAVRVDALIAQMMAHGIAPTPLNVFAIATDAGLSDDGVMLVLEPFEERLVGHSNPLGGSGGTL